MSSPDDHRAAAGRSPAANPAETVTPEPRPGYSGPAGVRPAAGQGEPSPPPHVRPAHPVRRWIYILGGLIALAIGLYYFVPWLITALNTVSTDDAYVNSHVTLVAPRVAGQVTKVWVDDNYRVKRGDILVQLDKEPYRVQVEVKKAAVNVAETNVVAARAQVHGQLARARASRFALEHAIEDVDNQVANLRAAVATLNSRKATLELAKANLKRGEELAPTGGISKEDLDVRRQTVKVDEAAVDQQLQAIHAIRVGLGLPEEPPPGHELSEVPPGLDQNFSTVRQALAELIQSAAQFGYFVRSWNRTPKQVVEEFYKQHPSENLDTIFAQLIPQAPAIKQAEAMLLQAKQDLAQAELNLLYCDVVSDIDGVVTRRNVNPGNNVQVGQSLMAVRSLSEVWVDANFKETQLDYLRIGQRVRCEVDMYGRKREFEGRITGFTMGTGETLALLPPQNATGNFVKIVQRLPVRIEFPDYNPEDYRDSPLFVGLSVEPYVYYKEPAQGPHAGEFLQPPAKLPTGPVEPTVETAPSQVKP